MNLTFHGVRGSTPSPGADFVRYGGHTSCVSIGRSLVLDAGTGLRSLASRLAGEPFRGTILLTHLHWDHTQGLPFFRPADHDDASTRLVMPAQGDAREVWERFMSPPFFPIGVDGLRGDWSVEGLEPGGFEEGGLVVKAVEIPHKGGRTYGYRITDGRSTVAYMPDHSPLTLGDGPGFGALHSAALELADGVDALIHDAQFTAAELDIAKAFGHAAVEYALELGAEAGARRVVLFHHDPSRTDDALDAIANAATGAIVAHEGLELDL